MNKTRERIIMKNHMEYNPDLEEVRFDDVIYDTDTVVANVGKIKGEKGRFNASGSFRWKIDRERNRKSDLLIHGVLIWTFIDVKWLIRHPLISVFLDLM